MAPLMHLRKSLLLAVLVVFVALARWASTSGPGGDSDAPASLLRFEKEDLQGIRIERSDGTLEFVRVDGVWQAKGVSWRPNAAMIRRVGHQLHDLDARAEVAESGRDLEAFGLGPEQGVRVSLTLRGGRTLGFVAGDPNPTGVSWYFQPLGDDRIYVVKKAAVEYYLAAPEAFREDRIAIFDVADVESLEATVDERTLRFSRQSERTWVLQSPVMMPASRDQVRRMLGRISSMRALEFVADAPTSDTLTSLGLQPPQHRIAVRLRDGRSWTVEVGRVQQRPEGPVRLVHLVEDNAVYAVKDSLLEAYRVPMSALRDPLVLPGLRAADLDALYVEHRGRSVSIRRGVDGWTWSDDAPVPGATPRRLAAEVAQLQATEWPDQPGALPPAQWVIQLEGEGFSRFVYLALVEEQWWAWLDGDTEAVVVSAALADRCEDLRREAQRTGHDAPLQ